MTPPGRDQAPPGEPVTGGDPAAVIDLRGVTVRRGGRTILGPIDWTVGTDERWVVIGPNGSGKTTLLSVAGLTLWPTTGTVDVLGARYGRIDSRELRRRIGAAGTAIESILRDDLTPVDLVMSALHAATEPWWHVYTDVDRVRARGAPRRLGLERGHGPSVRDAVRRRAAAGLDRPGADARPGPPAARRTGRESRPRRARDAGPRPRRARRQPATRGHRARHPPRRGDPAGLRPALVLADGGVVAAGRSTRSSATAHSAGRSGCRSSSSGATADMGPARATARSRHLPDMPTSHVGR